MSRMLNGFLTKQMLPISSRHGQFSNMLMSTNLNAEFEKAKEKLNTLQNEPGNDIKLKIYALFKQATVGENTEKKPSASNFVAQAKWSAWHSLGKMSVDDAKKKYVDMINNLAESEKGEKK